MSVHAKDEMMKIHIQNWQSSGLSQRKYCQQQNIRPDMFCYYKKKLSTSLKKVPKSNQQLIPIDLKIEPPGIKAIQLSHTNGFSLQINLEQDINELKLLLELVRSVA